MTKLLSACSKGIRHIYLLMMSLILVSSIILFKHYYPSDNNCLFYPLAVCILWTMIRTVGKRRLDCLKRLADSNFKVIATGLVFVTLILQMGIIWLYPFTYNSDNLFVKEQAIAFANGIHWLDSTSEYFLQFPNNLNITLLFGMLYHLFGNWEAVALVGVLMTDMACLLSALTIRKITRSNVCSLAFLVLTLYFIGFTFFAYIPYTHSYGIMFSMLLVYLYYSNLKGTWKALSIAAVAALGYEMKATTLIPFVAVVGCEGLRLLERRNWKAMAYAVGCVVCCFVLAEAVRIGVWKSVGYEVDETRRNGMSYFLLLGQSTASGGACDGRYAELASTMRRPKEERNALFLEETRKNIKEREWSGNADFYMGKFCMCWGDGTLDSYKSECKNPFAQKILQVYKWPRQILWYIVLTLMFLSFFYNRNDEMDIVYASVVGVVLYLSLFEAESRYLFMFTPVIFIIPGACLYRMIRFPR